MDVLRKRTTEYSRKFWHVFGWHNQLSCFLRESAFLCAPANRKLKYYMKISEDFKNHRVKFVIYQKVTNIVWFIRGYCGRAPLTFKLQPPHIWDLFGRKLRFSCRERVKQWSRVEAVGVLAQPKMLAESLLLAPGQFLPSGGSPNGIAYKYFFGTTNGPWLAYPPSSYGDPCVRVPCFDELLTTQAWLCS